MGKIKRTSHNVSGLGTLASVVPPQTVTQLRKVITLDEPKPQPRRPSHQTHSNSGDPETIALGDMLRGLENWVRSLGKDPYDLLTQAELEDLAIRVFGLTKLYLPRSQKPVGPGTVSPGATGQLLQMRRALCANAAIRFDVTVEEYSAQLETKLAESNPVEAEFRSRVKRLRLARRPAPQETPVEVVLQDPTPPATEE